MYFCGRLSWNGSGSLVRMQSIRIDWTPLQAHYLIDQSLRLFRGHVIIFSLDVLGAVTSWKGDTSQGEYKRWPKTIELAKAVQSNSSMVDPVQWTIIQLYGNERSVYLARVPAATLCSRIHSNLGLGTDRGVQGAAKTWSARR